MVTTPAARTTAQERARARLSRALLGGASAGFAKAVNVATLLAVVPLTLRYLGPERYGLWMTVTSLLMMLSFADLGLGNGLVSAVASASGREDREDTRKAVSTAFVLLGGIGLLLLVAFAVAYPRIPWAWLLNLSSEQLASEAGPAVAVLLGCFALGLPLAVTSRVLTGHQETHRANLWLAAGNVLGLASLSVVVRLHGSLPLLVLAAAGSPVVAALAATAHEFGSRRRWLQPQITSFCPSQARRLLGAGSMFVVLQLAATVLVAADNIIIAHTLGTEAVTQYAVPARLFSVVPVVIGLAMNPFWPAYAEASARGDGAWIRTTLTRSVVLAAVMAGGAAIALVLAGPLILAAWVGEAVRPNTALLLGLGAWGCLSAIGSSVSTALNGLGVLKLQAACATVAMVVAVTTKVVLASRFGLAGVAWGVVPGYAAIVLAPGVWAARRALGETRTAPARQEGT
jgi:O-antigen/teichoic acid export membrane protein